LRSLQEIQPDFEEEATKAYAGLWSQGKNKEEKKFHFVTKM
jgi:hypothetical protein